MSDPNNTTISPQEARRSGTRIMRAIQTEKDRIAAAPPVDPHVEFARGVVRNLIGGAVGYWTAVHLNAAFNAAMKEGYTLSKVDALRFGIPILGAMVTGFLLAPKQTFTALRFFGLGGIVDKLPFVKKVPEPSA